MYKLFLSLRYLRRRTTAILAVLAVTFGVATLLTVLSIMEGYTTELQTMIREQEAHLSIRSDGGLCGAAELAAALRELPHVVETAPYLETLAMYRSQSLNPCYLRSVDAERDLRTTALGKFLLRPEELDAVLEAAGSPREATFRETVDRLTTALLRDPERAPLTPEEAARLFSLEWRKTLFERQAYRLEFEEVYPSAVVVGVHLLAKNHLMLGSTVSTIALQSGAEGDRPVTGLFMVTGAIKTGDFEVDSRLFLVSYNRMTTFLGSFVEREGMFLDCCHGIRIALDDHRRAEEMKPPVQDVLTRFGAGGARISTWRESKEIFLQAVMIEKWIMGFVVSLLNIFTGCIILLMLVLIVIEKTRDAGVLLALGATPRGVFSIFLINGLIISALGTGLGLGAGAAFLVGINDVHDWIHRVTGRVLFDPEVYLMDRIPVLITPQDIVLAIVPALVFGLVASLVPALWAARKDPIQAIRYE